MRSYTSVESQSTTLRGGRSEALEEWLENTYGVGLWISCGRRRRAGKKEGSWWHEELGGGENFRVAGAQPQAEIGRTTSSWRRAPRRSSTL
jgi:hypothetical protein